MKSRQVAHETPKSVSDSQKVKFGAGSIPRILVLPAKKETTDKKRVRFGAGSIPHALR